MKGGRGGFEGAEAGCWTCEVEGWSLPFFQACRSACRQPLLRGSGSPPSGPAPAPRPAPTLGGCGMVSVRRAKRSARLFLSSSALKAKLNWREGKKSRVEGREWRQPTEGKGDRGEGAQGTYPCTAGWGQPRAAAPRRRPAAGRQPCGAACLHWCKASMQSSRVALCCRLAPPPPHLRVGRDHRNLLQVLDHLGAVVGPAACGVWR